VPDSQQEKEGGLPKFLVNASKPPPNNEEARESKLAGFFRCAFSQSGFIVQSARSKLIG
jgi:hypothetical protein